MAFWSHQEKGNLLALLLVLSPLSFTPHHPHPSCLAPHASWPPRYSPFSFTLEFVVQVNLECRKLRASLSLGTVSCVNLGRLPVLPCPRGRGTRWWSLQYILRAGVQMQGRAVSGPVRPLSQASTTSGEHLSILPQSRQPLWALGSLLPLQALPGSCLSSEPTQIFLGPRTGWKGLWVSLVPEGTRETEKGDSLHTPIPLPHPTHRWSHLWPPTFWGVLQKQEVTCSQNQLLFPVVFCSPFWAGVLATMWAGLWGRGRNICWGSSLTTPIPQHSGLAQGGCYQCPEGESIAL